MDDQSLRNVLMILRRISTTNPNATVVQFIETLADTSLSPEATLRIAAYILDQIAAARLVIENSQLVQEAKSGVLSALTAMDRLFSLSTLTGNFAAFSNQVSGYISNLVILLSASGVSTERLESQEAVDLASDIEELAKQFNDPQIDPLVRDVALKHMLVLATLLRQIPIFGIEPALSTYFEMVMKLRRADIGTSEKSKGHLDSLFTAIKSWNERLGVIDKAVNSGARLFERAGGAKELLEYLPDIAGV